ncbi:MAG TPA: hypothetical protein VGM50_02185 [Gemmatimonadaceae bacterium]|jgi:hypothetical protein
MSRKRAKLPTKAASKPTKRRKNRWTYSYGLKPFVVFAYERRERGGQVFVRWTNLAKPDFRRPGEHKRDAMGLGIGVRDDGQKLDDRLVRAAEIAVQLFQSRLVTGAKPESAAEQAAELPVARPSAETLTLREGFALALDKTRGKYASIDTRRYDDMVRWESRLFGMKPGTRPLINPNIPWAALQLRDVRALWRIMADAFIRTEGREFGLRVAEQIVDALYSVSSWLREESRIAPDAARPPDGWRKRLREEWAQRTGDPLHRPHRPRHSVDEFRRIFAALNDPRVDPRIRLAIEIAAECRTGQVLRCTRRMLTITDAPPSEYDALPAGSLGQIVIPGAGKKHGETVVLTPEQRRAVDDALSGYLANYDVAWRAEEIDDYFLFPGKAMRMLDDSGRRWARRVRAGVKALTRDGARVLFLRLEVIAKVGHVPGRGWYGLRRQAADMAETATNDDRVKDRLGGWQDSETRKSIYQDRETDDLRAQAASVRRQLRTGRALVVVSSVGAINQTDDPANAEESKLDDLLNSLTATQRAALRARLR